MAAIYKLTISAPRTATTRQREWVFTPETNAVQSIQVSLRKDGKRISTLEARLCDPGWQVFNSLPDWGFHEVPIRLELTPVSTAIPFVVFDGLVTTGRFGFPGPTQITLVANDKSVKARKRALGRTFSNVTSLDVARKISQEYGWTLDAQTGSAVIKRRAIDLGLSAAPLSDWDHMTRALAADGLRAHVVGTTLKIRQVAKNVFPIPFRPDTGIVKSIEGSVDHVPRPGKSGNTHAPIPGDHSAAPVLSSRADKLQSAAEDAPLVSGMAPVSGPDADVRGSHSESSHKQAFANQGEQKRRRKDSLSVTCRIIDDFDIDHIATFEGWGAKIDGNWDTDTLSYSIVSTGDPIMQIGLTRGASTAALKTISAEQTRAIEGDFAA